jgi:hypothetical protein
VKWPGGLIVDTHVVVNGSDQISNAAERTASYASPGDLREPAFDLIQPRGTGRREVRVVAWVRGKPSSNLRMLVSSVVIKHHVNIQRWIYRLLDAAKKSEKLLVLVPQSALG